jgi:hypothetical protein
LATVELDDPDQLIPAMFQLIVEETLTLVDPVAVDPEPNGEFTINMGTQNHSVPTAETS